MARRELTTLKKWASGLQDIPFNRQATEVIPVP
jgi:hypothetical protein